MKNYKNKRSGEVISKDCFEKLGISKQMDFIQTSDNITHSVSQDSSGNFALSMAVGMATHNAALGSLVGGDMLGGVIGSMF